MRRNWIGTAALALALAACGGGSGDDGDPLLPPTFDATGIWIAQVFANFSNPAGNEDQNSAAQVTVTQTGNDVTVDVPGDEPVTYTGTVSGADYRVTATLPEDDGSTAETIEFTLASADAGTGTLRWTFSGTGGPIDGGANLTVSRQVAALFDMAGTWDLTQSGNFSNPPGNEGANGTTAHVVTQAGNAFTITIDGQPRMGFLSGGDYFVEYDVDVGGGITMEVFVQFTLTTANAGTGSLLWKTDDDLNPMDGGADVTLARQ